MKPKFYASGDFPGRVFTAAEVRDLCGVGERLSLAAYVKYGIRVGGRHVFRYVEGAAPAKSKPAPKPVAREPEPVEVASRPTPRRLFATTPSAPPASTGFRMAHETVDDLLPVNGQRIAAAPDPEPRAEARP